MICRRPGCEHLCRICWGSFQTRLFQIKPDFMSHHRARWAAHQTRERDWNWKWKKEEKKRNAETKEREKCEKVKGKGERGMEKGKRSAEEGSVITVWWCCAVSMATGTKARGWPLMANCILHSSFVNCCLPSSHFLLGHGTKPRTGGIRNHTSTNLSPPRCRSSLPLFHSLPSPSISLRPYSLLASFISSLRALPWPHCFFLSLLTFAFLELGASSPPSCYFSFFRKAYFCKADIHRDTTGAPCNVFFQNASFTPTHHLSPISIHSSKPSRKGGQLVFR